MIQRYSCRQGTLSGVLLQTQSLSKRN